MILITGGAKGITAECARALGHATGATLVLVGSSPAPPPGATGELAQTLEHFRADGLIVRYESCDMTDQRAVTALVRRIHDELGPITGVVTRRV